MRQQTLAAIFVSSFVIVTNWAIDCFCADEYGAMVSGGVRSRWDEEGYGHSNRESAGNKYA